MGVRFPPGAHMNTDFIIYSALALSSFVNTLVPISGSSTVTPFLAILTDPHRAIGLASFFFLLSGIIRIYLFRENIRWEEVRVLFLPSVFFASLGALSLVAIPTAILLWIILLATVYFFLKKIGLIKKTQKESSKTTFFVGALSGFLQGSGFGGSDLRNSYLYARQFSLIEVHGTTGVIGASIFGVATVIRLLTEQLTVPDLVPLIYVFPFILFGTLLGRKVLFKLSKKITNTIIVLVMFVIIVFLFLRILGL